MATIKIKYKNQEHTYEKGVTLLEISNEFKDDFKSDIIVATINNRLVSLDSKITKNCNVDFYDVFNILGSRTYIRGLFFLFIKAVKDVLNSDVKLMYFVDKGVYCEILTNNLISEVTVEKIKIRMKELVDGKLPITKIMVSRFDAIDYFSKINQMDKAQSLRFISNSTISLYKLDNTLDYFYGVLPRNTSYLTKFNVKYLKENKVMLLPPYTFEEDEKLNFDKNNKLIENVDVQAKYLENININTSVELNNTISTGKYGDVIRISESIFNNQLFKIVDNITKNKDIKIVLITGPSSGKTTISKNFHYF